MNAHHWTTFGLGSEIFEPYGIVNGALEVSVSSELARDEADKLVPMYGNRYWPTLIKLLYEEEHGWGDTTHTVSADLFLAGLTAPMARDLATMLNRAADLADSIDGPCSEPSCGHWAPCDCGCKQGEP